MTYPHSASMGKYETQYSIYIFSMVFVRWRVYLKQNSVTQLMLFSCRPVWKQLWPSPWIYNDNHQYNPNNQDNHHHGSHTTIIYIIMIMIMIIIIIIIITRNDRLPHLAGHASQPRLRSWNPKIQKCWISHGVNPRCSVVQFHEDVVTFLWVVIFFCEKFPSFYTLMFVVSGG